MSPRSLGYLWREARSLNRNFDLRMIWCVPYFFPKTIKIRPDVLGFFSRRSNGESSVVNHSVYVELSKYTESEWICAKLLSDSFLPYLIYLYANGADYGEMTEHEHGNTMVHRNISSADLKNFENEPGVFFPVVLCLPEVRGDFF